MASSLDAYNWVRCLQQLHFPLLSLLVLLTLQLRMLGCHVSWPCPLTAPCFVLCRTTTAAACMRPTSTALYTQHHRRTW